MLAKTESRCCATEARCLALCLGKSSRFGACVTAGSRACDRHSRPPARRAEHNARRTAEAAARRGERQGREYSEQELAERLRDGLCVGLQPLGGGACPEKDAEWEYTLHLSGERGTARVCGVCFAEARAAFKSELRTECVRLPPLCAFVSYLGLCAADTASSRAEYVAALAAHTVWLEAQACVGAADGECGHGRRHFMVKLFDEAAGELKPVAVCNTHYHRHLHSWRLLELRAEAEGGVLAASDCTAANLLRKCPKCVRWCPAPYELG